MEYWKEDKNLARKVIRDPWNFKFDFNEFGWQNKTCRWCKKDYTNFLFLAFDRNDNREYLRCNLCYNCCSEDAENNDISYYGVTRYQLISKPQYDKVLTALFVETFKYTNIGSSQILKAVQKYAANSLLEL